METAPTEHETRARNAKAQALATVLEAAGASAGDLATPTFAVGSIAWELAAQAATARGLLGTKPNGDPRPVNAPHSQATVRAVAHILELAAKSVTVADPDAMKSRTTMGVVFNHRLHGTMTVAGESAIDHRYVMARKGDNTPGRAIPVRKSEMRTLAQASAGYRSHLSAVAPQPETTEADLSAFDGFPR